MAKATVPPSVPTPAPALISPVGCSSTIMSITLRSLDEPCETFVSTVLNIFLALISATDFSKLKLVNGSPSSNKSSPLKTFSLVTVFPKILILSTSTFFPSLILNFMTIESSSTISSTLCSTNCKLLYSINSSIFSNYFFTLKGE